MISTISNISDTEKYIISQRGVLLVTDTLERSNVHMIKVNIENMYKKYHVNDQVYAHISVYYLFYLLLTLLVCPSSHHNFMSTPAMIKSLAQSIRNDIFYVHLQGHGTHYGISNEVAYNDGSGFIMTGSFITGINPLLLKILQLLPNVKFVSCGTCQTGSYFFILLTI